MHYGEAKGFCKCALRGRGYSDTPKNQHTAQLELLSMFICTKRCDEPSVYVGGSLFNRLSTPSSPHLIGSSCRVAPCRTTCESSGLCLTLSSPGNWGRCPSTWSNSPCPSLSGDTPTPLRSRWVWPMWAELLMITQDNNCIGADSIQMCLHSEGHH